MAISSGSDWTTAGSSQSMTTDVSTSPTLTSEALVDDPVEVGSELAPVDVRSPLRQCRDLGPGDEGAAAGPGGAKLGDLLTIPCDDECLTGDHGVDDLGVVVSKLPLRDDPGHGITVAWCATRCYPLLMAW